MEYYTKVRRKYIEEKGSRFLENGRHSIVIIGHGIQSPFQVKRDSNGEYMAIDLDGRNDILNKKSFDEVFEAIKKTNHLEEDMIDFFFVNSLTGFTQLLSQYQTFETIIDELNITKSDAVSMLAKAQDILGVDFVEVNGVKIKKSDKYSTDYKVSFKKEKDEYFDTTYTMDLTSIIK